MKTVLFLIFCSVAAAQNTLVFNVNNGDTQCSLTKVAGATIKFSYQCSNARGSMAGSYTANAVATTPAADSLTFGITSTVTNTSLLCMVAINATANPVSFGSLGTVPANAIGYSCTGQNNKGGQVTWP